MISKRLDNVSDIIDDQAIEPLSAAVLGNHSDLSYFSTRLKANIPTRSELRTRIIQAYRRAEGVCVSDLLSQADFYKVQSSAIQATAMQLATALRHKQATTKKESLLQNLLQAFSLSSQEGVALMCLAEALLRIPDVATRDMLIRDKIAPGNWHDYLGKSHSLFVNAAAWGLLITGKLVSTHNETNLSSILTRLLAKGGEPLIRKAVNVAMRLMGEQFVMGETIDEALARAREREAKGFSYSYDMLGEAAQTAEDAERYLLSYQQAIHAIGQAANGKGVYLGSGVSIKLSALHPRYSYTQHERVMTELYPRVKALAILACHYNIGLNLDAEETDRLDLSLDILEKLCFEPELDKWLGMGFVVQAYQKRAPFVIDFVIDLARRCQHRLMIRLVKGAYWDSEIKRAQQDGFEDYPVYTRKAYTDISYLVCAKKMLAAADAIYPQFATHNAHTVAAVALMAQHSEHRMLTDQYEFQCLHGMGETLYDEVQACLGRTCRIYAPVGSHQTLLPYLVRRLLENGANTSFVNQIANTDISIDALIADPCEVIKQFGLQPTAHPKIPLPIDLYRSEQAISRLNSSGIDLSDEHLLNVLSITLDKQGRQAWIAAPVLGDPDHSSFSETIEPIVNPADHRDIVGSVQQATLSEVAIAVRWASKGTQHWSTMTPADRAAILERAATIFEEQCEVFIALAVREAGKSIANAIGEVREAVDFLRYYAAQLRVEKFLQNVQPLGPIVCISPWNFPLAIFIGQISAALAAGNPVLAKPAEQTPLIAAQAARVLHQAGVPRSALQLLPGKGGVIGQALVASHEIAGVMFTGSTAVARIIQQQLAGRLNQYGQPLTLIAETGGQNAMIVDSSALPEQVVKDVLQSAFDSAGQRCSALRVLCLQEEIAQTVLTMLKGAMCELVIGDPGYLTTDIGPVIDKEAYTQINSYLEEVRAKYPVYQINLPTTTVQHGTFIAPTLIEIPSLNGLHREIFGPVLHIVRYQRPQLDSLLEMINQLGYGLTMGIHTRIDETVKHICTQAKVGNLYVNRNMIGAVVGVQPFGGQGLSGTGPKAGGPLLLSRLLAETADTELASLLTTSTHQNISVLDKQIVDNMHSLCLWLHSHNYIQLTHIGKNWLRQTLRPGKSWTLTGPTGEENSYTLLPRQAALCIADNPTDLLLHTLACLNSANLSLWSATEANHALYNQLPIEIKKNVQLIAFSEDGSLNIGHQLPSYPQVILFAGSQEKFSSLSQHVSKWPGPLIQISMLSLKNQSNNVGDFSDLKTKQCQPNQSWLALSTRLMHEQVISINTAAAGGNASLMVIG